MKNAQNSCVVYVVDDEAPMLRMVTELLDSVGIKAIAYKSAADFIEQYVPGPCECLVSDIRMPGIGGMELQRLINQKGYTLPVIFVTGYAEVGTAVNTMKLGAFDYIEKPFAHQLFLETVQRALERSRVLFAERARLISAEARLALLTSTEARVLKLLVKGKSSKNIADVIGIGSRTVDNHRGRIMEKLHVNSTIELVLMFAHLLPD
ncbi:MAG: response regulator [Sterolibacterium sp.]